MTCKECRHYPWCKVNERLWTEYDLDGTPHLGNKVEETCSTFVKRSMKGESNA